METLRNRIKENKFINGNNNEGEKEKVEPEPEFMIRESRLTILIASSAHIRAIYHIFIVILVMLFFDTVIYDLVETGKINVGQHTVVAGFGDVKRGFKLWTYLFLVAIAFYPLLRLYVAIGTLLRKNSGLCRIWSIIGVVGLVTMEGLLVGLPIWDLKRKHLETGSSASVTLEMVRFAMKIHAAGTACGPRGFTGKPLPSFKHYLYFLFAPTLLYRDQYPRTNKIRWGFVLARFLEVAAIVLYNSFLWERFILPYWSDFGKKPSVEAGTVVRGIFGCVLPGMISFLCGFYCLLHAWCNAFAEMMRFGDRLFYEDWWTASRFSRYFRIWNLVVYSWLRDHIYKPLLPRTGKTIAAVSVFLVSSVVHEVILTLSFGFFYPVLFIQFGVCGLLMVPLTAKIGKSFPNVLNIFMWLSLFLGNGLLWSLYPMEYFARKNCPPSESDSFFIPKSWSCPKIILKPDWSFQNPLNVFL